MIVLSFLHPCYACVMCNEFIGYRFAPVEFSLSAYKRNKRKMEIAEKMDTPENPMKRRRQSSETVSTLLQHLPFTSVISSPSPSDGRSFGSGEKKERVAIFIFI